MFYIAMIGVSWHFSGEMFFQGFSVHCFFFALKIIVRLWISPLHPGFLTWQQKYLVSVVHTSSTGLFSVAMLHYTLPYFMGFQIGHGFGNGSPPLLGVPGISLHGRFLGGNKNDHVYS